MSEEHPQHNHGLVVDEALPQTKRAPLFQVVLLNDDYTPMEFVVDVGAHFSAWTARLRPVSCSR